MSVGFPLSTRSRLRAIEVIDANPVRIIIAIRNVGVCELLVARDKWDPFKFLALIDQEIDG